MLYRPERHEPLCVLPWDEGNARATIAEIVADTEAHFDPEKFWPNHPREETEGILKGLWYGAAGVIWALDYLVDAGVARTRIDPAEAIDRLHVKSVMEDPRIPYAGSFLMGEVGILLVRWRITREPAAANLLYTLIAQNAAQATDEMMWGVPGTAFAASFMWDWTGEERWRDLLLKTLGEMWSRWKYRPELRCHVWRQRLYRPEPRIFLGPVHGFSGNACVMMRGAPLMTEAQREEMYDRIAVAAKATVHLEAQFANWLALADTPPPDAPAFILERVPWLVQWCHGAPGTLGALSSYPKDRDPAIESLFHAGGELTFAAGPLTKGPNLCHGTGGNGILFLKLHHRTGGPTWLDRARAFAMHGIEQYRRQRHQYGHGWYSLWTGDLGFAVYLWHCITSEPGFPTMDFT